jgi:hypothetical protein
MKRNWNLSCDKLFKNRAMSFKNDTSPNKNYIELWRSLKSPRYDDPFRYQKLAPISDEFLLEPKQEYGTTRAGVHAWPSVRDAQDPCNGNGNSNEDKDKDKKEALFFNTKKNIDSAIGGNDAKTYNSSDLGFKGSDSQAVLIAGEDKRQCSKAQRLWHDQHTGFFLEQL